MKKLFFSLVALMVAAMSYAQNTLVATLSHGEDISMYYGTYALRDAMTVAQSGDVINLSGGAFQATNITKGVILRGTGIDDANPTYIIQNFTINIPTDDTHRFSMEGIKCANQITMSGTFANAYFFKSQFNTLIYDTNASIKNTQFADCKITGGDFSLRGSSTVLFINSYVSGFRNWSDSTGSLFTNCVIFSRDSGYYTNEISFSQLRNCIIFNMYNNGNFYGVIPATSVCNNCVSINYRSNIFDSTQANTGNKAATFTEVFKNFTGTYSDDQTFELTDEAKTKYLGTDGTEVGMYGGVLPYSPVPSYPQITKMNVANKTTADGKLSVEIEVSAAE